MAKVVVDSQDVVAPWRSNSLRFLSVACVSGVAWWALTGILSRFVIEPIACRSSATLTACGDSVAIAGTLAVLIVAAGSLFAFVLLRQPRPLIISIGSAALLWGLGLYTAGLAWYEALLWAVILYSLVYLFLMLVVRVRSVWASVIVAFFGVVLIRLLVAF